jgi:hypothetical protein
MEELIKIQSELKAPKSQRNTFGNYNYRNAEDILEAVKPLLASNGCILTLTDTIELIGNRFYVKATANLTNASGYNIQVNAYAREEESKKGMDGSQISGASSSYARKYALNGLFLIDDTKDSDATNTHDKEPKQETTPTPPKPRLLLNSDKFTKAREFYLKDNSQLGAIKNKYEVTPDVEVELIKPLEAQ